MIPLPASRARRIADVLLTWYRKYQRTMPWRGHHDPYAIWLSEIMLQQTRVETVGDYFRRFMNALPTIDALANAPLDDVLKLWEGLGYYTRARNLHKAARVIVTQHDGCVPDDVEALRALPGIGRYTAGAIASIAYGRAEPVLDGNVIRVLCRLFRIHDDPKTAATHEALWQLAATLLPHDAPGEFNQAVMDLGATICTPRQPQCSRCPIRRFCAARSANEQEQLPFKKKAKPVPHHTIVVGVIRKGRGRSQRILIGQRPTTGMLGGLWEFPGGKVEPDETLESALKREIHEEVALRVRVGKKIAEVDHAYSHFKITLHAFECRVTAGEAKPIACDQIRWVAPDKLRDYAFPKANLRVLDELMRPV